LHIQLTGTCEITFEFISFPLLIYYFEAATKESKQAAQSSPITTAQSYKFPFHYPFRFYKAMAAMTAAPIIPAPALKPLPAFFVAVAGAEVEATEDAALDPAVADVTGALADVAAVTTDEATEVAEETADAAVDATEARLVEDPLARAAEQISVARLLVAVA
jgi:hypothetical protein